MDKSFRLHVNDPYDDYDYYYSTEEEMINAIIKMELSSNEFKIFKVLNPKDYSKYNESLNNLIQLIEKELEKSRSRLEELNKQKENSNKLLNGNVCIFDHKRRI